MVGENIRKLRTEKGMTQKALADQLFVTPQAVSRWENGEVEPSISTVSDIAKIFQVTSDEILGIASPEPEVKQEETKEETKEEKAEFAAKQEPPKQMLALCARCNEPIYNKENIVRHSYSHISGRTRTYTDEIICRSCDEKQKKRAREIANGESRKARLRSYIFGGLTAILALIIGLAGATADGAFDGQVFGVWAGIGVFGFFFVSCLFLKNNFVLDMFATVASWGVKFPGLIFNLSLDGIIWFLTVKLVLFLISTAISILCFFLALALGFAVSVFVYPFALMKSINRPEETE